MRQPLKRTDTDFVGHETASSDIGSTSTLAEHTVRKVLEALIEPLPPNSVPRQREIWTKVLHSVGDLTAATDCGQHVLQDISRRLTHSIAGETVGGQAWVAALEDCGRNFVERCAALIEGAVGVPPTVLPRLLGSVVQLAEVLGSVAPLFRAIERELAVVSERVVRLEFLYSLISHKLDVTSQSVAMLDKVAADADTERAASPLSGDLSWQGCSKRKVPQCSKGLASVTAAKVGSSYATPHDGQEASPMQGRSVNSLPRPEAGLATTAMTIASATSEKECSRDCGDVLGMHNIAVNALSLESPAVGLTDHPEHHISNRGATWRIQTACAHPIESLMGSSEQIAADEASHLLSYGLACVDALPNADPLSALARTAFSHVATLLKEAYERHPSMHTPEFTSTVVTGSLPPWEGLDQLAIRIAAWATDELAPIDASLAKSVVHSAAGLKALVCLVR